MHLFIQFLWNRLPLNNVLDLIGEMFSKVTDFPKVCRHVMDPQSPYHWDH